ncbi:MAG: hypothetical protein WCK37_01885 [Candidatus Falkowbacteria bacterium]
MLLVVSLVASFLYGEQATTLAGNRARANMLAEGGLEAVRNIRDASFTNLVDGTYYLSTSSNQWSLTSTPDNLGIFTRQISIGTIDAKRKVVTSTVSWLQGGQQNVTISLTTLLTNWQVATTPTAHGGMLVYSIGASSNENMVYQTLSAAGVWSATSSMADVSTSTTNRYARALTLYSSNSRQEKIAISRHYNGTTQYIYSQVYNSASSSWGNVQLLSSWNATTYLDVQNFDGTYLANGDFMALYSDNSTTTKYRIWNGTSWGAQNSINPLATGGIPNFIVARNRPGTNEVMVATFDQASDANTEYFNGGTYTLTNWSGPVSHDVSAPLATKKFVDFAWSPNNSLIGGLIYTGANSKKIGLKIFTANGSGGGTWSTAIATGVQTSNIGALDITANPKASEFIFCDKDANTTPRIICYKSDFTPAISVPTNNTLTSNSDTGIQRSYDNAFGINTTTAISVYSDVSTSSALLKKYNSGTVTWDSASTSIAALGATLETVRLIPDNQSDDILILLANTSQQLFSVFWNSASSTIYTTPVGKALVSHTGSGSADEDYWYDFTWD